MSLISTAGASNANSYISLSDANTYFATRESSDEWIFMGSTGTLSATTRKENLLKQAVREIDRTFRYFGTKYNQGERGASDYQSLEFPRSNDLDANNNLIIPYDIQYGQCEQALYITQRGATRYTEEGNPVKMPTIGDSCYNYLSKYITRQVQPVGKYSWQ